MKSMQWSRRCARRLACVGLALSCSMGWAQTAGGPPALEAAPRLEIVFPPPSATVTAGRDSDRSVGVVVDSNFRLLPAGQCGGDRRCGHLHLKVDPQGDSCNLPGRAYNSMNSDVGGSLIRAHLGACPEWQGEHVIGVLLADDHHRPVLVDGKPVTATVKLQVN